MDPEKTLKHARAYLRKLRDTKEVSFENWLKADTILFNAYVSLFTPFPA